MSQAYQLRPDRDLTVLIPARAGSKRVPGKNTRALGGKPLIQWSIDSAKAANVAQIIVSTDDAVSEAIAYDNGCQIHHRKPAHATDDAPDITWVLDVLPMVTTPYIAICRPTSPFRTASTIRRCYATFMASKGDSIRGVTKVSSPHPAKMWVVAGSSMHPVLEGAFGITPWHSMPTQLLPVVYMQNASIEMVSVGAIERTGTISGGWIAPFFTEALEGIDINTEADFLEAERLLHEREAGLDDCRPDGVGGRDRVRPRPDQLTA